MDNLTLEDSDKAEIVASPGSGAGRVKPSALPPLSAEEMATAAQLSRELIRADDDLDEIVTWGSDAQAEAAQIAKDMLRGVQLRNLDEVVQLSDGILADMRTLDVGILTPVARRILFVLRESTDAVQRRIKAFFRKYELINARLDRQEAEIFAKEAASTDRYHKDAALARSTVALLIEARLKTKAIELFLEGEQGHSEAERRLHAVEQEKAAARAEARSVDFMIVTSADRYCKYIERLETKRMALHQVILTAYQTGVTIRNMADNENIVRQKLSDIRTELLPHWRHLFAMAYQAYQQQGIAEFVGKIAAADTRLRLGVADQLEKTAEAMADTMTRPVIDIDSMRYYHEKLVSSLDKLRTASFEARKSRDVAETEMHELIRKLSEAVADTSLRQK